MVFVLGPVVDLHAGLEQEILGKWRYKGKQTGATIESVAEFKTEGVYSCRMTVGFLGTASTITFKGKWRVEEESHIVVEVTETDSPLFLPKGKVMRKESVQIKDDVMAYQYGGKPEREVRVTDPAENEKKAEEGTVTPTVDPPSSPNA